MELEDMTHEELATYGRNQAAIRNNDDLWEAARDLQNAVDMECDSKSAASMLIDLLRS